MRLRYTPRALAELDEILTFITDRSPQGARRVHERIRTITELLALHPHAGKATNLRGMRRMAVAPYPYLIFYELTEDEVVIVGVRHGARAPKSMPDNDQP